MLVRLVRNPRSRNVRGVRHVAAVAQRGRVPSMAMHGGREGADYRSTKDGKHEKLLKMQATCLCCSCS